ncbi:glycosyltransferase family 4 protein [Kribbella sp. NPDC051718]|uniref:glycosyltransferase family 4 protein n=1 Tax=Kribbella sp. NPDC051718 TaxID=3155168 RepID=UPI00341FA407
MPNVVSTWYSSASGGAEVSGKMLSSQLRTLRGVRSTHVVWNGRHDGDDDSAQSGGWDLATYQRTVTGLLDQPGSVLISNHRTVAVDAPLAGSLGVPIIVVMRGIVLPDKEIRVVRDDGTFARHRPADLGWGRIAVDRWVGISQASARSLTIAGVSRDQVTVVHNGVAVNRPAPVPVAAGGRIRFAMAGRAAAWKQFGLGIDAAAILRDRGADISLTLLVAGPGEDQLRALVEERGLEQNVRFAGWRGDFVSWLNRNVDCLIHPCSVEGFGRVVAEAGSVGVPAIVADRGGPREIVRDGETGLHFRADDAGDLAGRMAEFAALPVARRIAMAAATVARTRTLFSVEMMADRYLSLCRSVLGEAAA